MKNRRLLLLLTFLPFLFYSCKKKIPEIPTIITGKIVDENDKPIEGVLFYFGGGYRSGTNHLNSFSQQIKSDKNGIYAFTQIIPTKTQFVDFLSEYTTHPPAGYTFNLEIDNLILPIKEPISKKPPLLISGKSISIVYETTNQFNFRLTKR
jgi:hypothetical protein